MHVVISVILFIALLATLLWSAFFKAPTANAPSADTTNTYEYYDYDTSSNQEQ